MKHNEEAEQVPETAPETAPEAGSGWPVLELGRHRKGGLVEQIVIAISVMVGSRALRIGTRMPSVRQFAKCNGVSTFTVVESYDRLVNLGLLSSRRGSGYFVARHDVATSPHTAAHASASPSEKLRNVVPIAKKNVQAAIGRKRDRNVSSVKSLV